MHLLLLAGCLVIAACDRSDQRASASEPDAVREPRLAEPTRPAVVPVAPVPPVTAPAPAPVPAPAFGPPVRLATRSSQVLCAHDAAGRERCREVTPSYARTAPGTGYRLAAGDAPPRQTTRLIRDGVACTLAEDRLACGGATAHLVTRHPGERFDYVEDAGRWSWYEPGRATGPDDALELHSLALPAPSAQVAIGFRVGCARTTTAGVYCWSDPRRPRRIATPANVVELALQAPFELCVRTAAGEVHCTPPFVQAGAAPIRSRAGPARSCGPR